jgi:putative Mg2+ transporter-C (MgtC) family protein
MKELLKAIGYEHVDLLPVLIRLLLSAACGASIGMERTKKGRAAGLRTYSMVCLGATVVMMTGIALYERVGAGDPSRLGAQVVSGIGFLGAGAIIVTGYHEIRGLTTAAGLWVTACIGLAVGAGYYIPAILACVIIVGVMVFGSPVQHWIEYRSHRMRLLVFFDDPDSPSEFFPFGKKMNIELHDVETITSNNSGRIGMVFAVSFPSNIKHETVMDYLMTAPGVHFIERL